MLLRRLFVLEKRKGAVPSEGKKGVPSERKEGRRQCSRISGNPGHSCTASSSRASRRKLTGLKPSLQEIMADLGFFIQPL